MAGSIGVAAVVAKLAFVALLVGGVLRPEMSAGRIAVAAVIGLALWFGLPVLAGGDRFVTSALAIVDIALVFAVFKGDVRIT